MPLHVTPQEPSLDCDLSMQDGLSLSLYNLPLKDFCRDVMRHGVRRRIVADCYQLMKQLIIPLDFQIFSFIL